MVNHRLQLRPIVPEDYYSIYQDCIPHTEYHWAQKHYFSNLIDNTKDTFHYIAELTNTSIKVGHISGYIKESYGCLWIQTLMIYPKFVRQYYGTELYFKTIELFNNHFKIDKVRLTVFDANDIAHSFWASLDFIELFKFNKIINSRHLKVSIYERTL